MTFENTPPVDELRKLLVEVEASFARASGAASASARNLQDAEERLAATETAHVEAPSESRHSEAFLRAAEGLRLSQARHSAAVRKLEDASRAVAGVRLTIARSEAESRKEDLVRRASVETFREATVASWRKLLTSYATFKISAEQIQAAYQDSIAASAELGIRELDPLHAVMPALEAALGRGVTENHFDRLRPAVNLVQVALVLPLVQLLEELDARRPSADGIVVANRQRFAHFAKCRTWLEFAMLEDDANKTKAIDAAAGDEER